MLSNVAIIMSMQLTLYSNINITVYHYSFYEKIINKCSAVAEMAVQCSTSRILKRWDYSNAH